MSYILYSSQFNVPFLIGCKACKDSQCSVCKMLSKLTIDHPIYYDSQNLYFVWKRKDTYTLEMMNHKGEHWGVFDDIDGRGLIEIEKISTNSIFLFKYANHCIVQLNANMSFKVDIPIISIYSTRTSKHYLTIIQSTDGLVRVYKGDKCIKCIVIKSLIKVLGITSRNNIYCALKDIFVDYNWCKSSITRIIPMQKTNHFLTDGISAYTKEDFIKLDISSAVFLDENKKLTHVEFKQVVTFIIEHPDHDEAYILNKNNNISLHTDSVSLCLLKYDQS